MIDLVFASLIFAQQAGEGLVAIQPDDPVTWSVEYPYLIAPYVEDYRGCLNSANRIIGDGNNFENQHRSDLPRCEEGANEAIAKANDVLARRGYTQDTTPADVTALFRAIGQIHIARGRDVDATINTRLASNERYQMALAREQAQKQERLSEGESHATAE